MEFEVLTIMVYLNSFTLCDKRLRNPNIYPYNVFRDKYVPRLLFSPITVLYGNNGSGKSTILNLIAGKLGLQGAERYAYGQFYIEEFLEECTYDFGENEMGIHNRIPSESRYIKSEDILFEIKKIQEEDALEQGYIYEQVRRGMSKEEAKKEFNQERWGGSRKAIIKFAQEKYSNGETTMQLLGDLLEPDALYLLDEPEVSLSPQNQVQLAEDINQMARLLDTQFIIATHSPFMLGTLNAKIYNLDCKEVREDKWSNLDNVRFFYEFFKQREGEF